MGHVGGGRTSGGEVVNVKKRAMLSGYAEIYKFSMWRRYLIHTPFLR